MLNEISRKYFQRAFSTSGSAFSYYVLRRRIHNKHIQKCSKTNETSQMIEYLKTTNSRILARCYAVGHSDEVYPVWVPTFENPQKRGAFLSQSPEDIYNSDKAPVMDTMFGFASQVFPLQFRECQTVKLKWFIIF